MGVAWEFDLVKFVTDGSWYFVPVLAVRYWGRSLSDKDRCHFRSDAFIDRAARWYMKLLDGIGEYHLYSLDDARVHHERIPPFGDEYHRNGANRIENWNYAVPVSLLDRI